MLHVLATSFACLLRMRPFCPHNTAPTVHEPPRAAHNMHPAPPPPVPVFSKITKLIPACRSTRSYDARGTSDATAQARRRCRAAAAWRGAKWKPWRLGCARRTTTLSTARRYHSSGSGRAPGGEGRPVIGRPVALAVMCTGGFAAVCAAPRVPNWRVGGGVLCCVARHVTLAGHACGHMPRGLCDSL